jgi:hypothetical protein
MTDKGASGEIPEVEEQNPNASDDARLGPRFARTMALSAVEALRRTRGRGLTVLLARPDKGERVKLSRRLIIDQRLFLEIFSPSNG